MLLPVGPSCHFAHNKEVPQVCTYFQQGSCFREDQCSSQDLQPLVAGVVQLPFRTMCHLARVPAGADPQKLGLTFLPPVTSRIVPYTLSHYSGQ